MSRLAHNMVPGKGVKLNSEEALVTHLEAVDKDLPDELESFLSSENYMQFFNTLADWNSYLEEHVPYFNNQSDLDRPQL